jgi:hypothetical protein
MSASLCAARTTWAPRAFPVVREASARDRLGISSSSRSRRLASSRSPPSSVRTTAPSSSLMATNRISPSSRTCSNVSTRGSHSGLRAASRSRSAIHPKRSEGRQHAAVFAVQLSRLLRSSCTRSCSSTRGSSKPLRTRCTGRGPSGRGHARSPVLRHPGREASSLVRPMSKSSRSRASAYSRGSKIQLSSPTAPSDHIRFRRGLRRSNHVGAALGGVGWETFACQAITRFNVALCSSPSTLVASLRPLRGLRALTSPAPAQACTCLMVSSTWKQLCDQTLESVRRFQAISTETCSPTDSGSHPKTDSETTS